MGGEQRRKKKTREEEQRRNKWIMLSIRGTKKYQKIQKICG